MDEEEKSSSPPSGDEKHEEDSPPAGSSAPSSGEDEAPQRKRKGKDEAGKDEGSQAEAPAAARPSRPKAKSAGAGRAGGKARPKKKPRPVKRKGPVYEDLEAGDLLEALGEALGDDLLSAQSFLKQDIYTVHRGRLLDVMMLLREEHDFDYLVDVTALDYLGDDERWCLVYHLYSHSGQALIRVKTRIQDGEVAPSVSAIWKSADWMEREVFDMFGIEFTGHPDLKRILLPEDWHGHPLRKDYDIKLQDQSWINSHLRIRKVPD